jgi:hypothetical protein
MVGRLHSPTKHAFIYDTPEESLRDPYSNQTPKIYTAGPTVPVEETEVSSDESVMVEQSTPTPTQTPTIVSTPTPPPTTRPTPPPSSGGSSGYSSGGSGGSGY